MFTVYENIDLQIKETMNVTHICHLKRCMYREITRTELVQSLGKNDLFQERGSILHEGIHYGDCRC